MNQRRPSPDALLRAATREARGGLKIFLGAAPGVGKTFEMLRQGAERKAAGIDVVLGIVETHGRADTEALVAPLEVVARRVSEHRGHRLEEMDLDALLARAPALALVDELAHTNVEGSRNAKRWQDVEELLAAGIDVLTTLNIQHVESLNDVVASFTHVRVRETVPDHVLEGAEIEVVDLPPDELIARLKQGKVYVPEEASRALGHFFSKENLSALREMALRRAAENVDRRLVEHLDAHALSGTYAAGERVLVAVSELPGAETLVRAGKRLADAMRAPWQAVNIETPRSAGFGAEDHRRIADALRLAASLGATIATVPAANVTDGLIQHIANMRGTQLVLGRTHRSWWFELRHGSVVEALLRRSEGLAVHVIPSPDAPRRTRRARPRLGSWQSYPASAAIVAGTTLLAWLAQPWLGTGALDLLYLLPVVLASMRFGRWPGIAAGVLAGLAYNFFFLPPIYTFSIADPQAVVTVFVLLGLAVFVASLSDRLRTRALTGSRGAADNAAIAAFGQALARSSDAQTTADTVTAELSRLLDVQVLLLADRDGELATLSSAPAGMPELGPVDRAAADRAWSHAQVTGADTGTLSAADWQFHPLTTTLGTLALIGLSRSNGDTPVEPAQATMLATLLGQAALAHERLRLEDQMRDVRVIEARDRLRSALLSSIGHDLRTPLTAVTGAVDAIIARIPDDADALSARAELARLRRFLDNLLEMVRLDTGAVAPRIEPVDLTDAVAAALHDVRDVLPDDRLVFRVPPDLPLVPADPGLLHHVFLNLLMNAASHGRGQVTVTGTRRRDTVELTIADEGSGIAEEDATRMFDAFVRGAGSDRRQGSGLGLAIVRGFADAMHIRVAVANTEAGTAFTLTFNVEAPTAHGDVAQT